MFRGRPPSAAFKIYADKRTLCLAFARKTFHSHLNLSFKAKFDRFKRVLGPFIKLRVKYYGSFYNGNQWYRIISLFLLYNCVISSLGIRCQHFVRVTLTHGQQILNRPIYFQKLRVWQQKPECLLQHTILNLEEFPPTEHNHNVISSS